ncbi:hypothetical protein MRX96_042384 [Rhipicephalus microplus]
MVTVDVGAVLIMMLIIWRLQGLIATFMLLLVVIAATALAVVVAGALTVRGVSNHCDASSGYHGGSCRRGHDGGGYRALHHLTDSLKREQRGKSRSSPSRTANRNVRDRLPASLEPPVTSESSSSELSELLSLDPRRLAVFFVLRKENVGDACTSLRCCGLDNAL